MFAAVVMLYEAQAIFEFFSRALLSPELEKRSGIPIPKSVMLISWSHRGPLANKRPVMSQLRIRLILGASPNVL